MQSLRNKIDQLEVQLNLYNIDIACLTETHLKSFELDNVNIRGYLKTTAYCRTIHEKGGVIIFHKSTLSTYIKEINKINTKSVEKSFEVSGIEIKFDNKKINILTIYRSPCGNLEVFFDKLEMLLNELLRDKSMIILCGDLNIDFQSDSREKCRLYDLFNSLEISFHVQEPTRFDLRSSSGIDYICSNFLGGNNSNFSCEVVTNGMSDHTSQILCFDIPKYIPENLKNSVRTRLYSDVNYQTFLNYVREENWLEVYSAITLDEGFKAFIDSLSYYIDISFPFVYTNTCHNKNTWITPGIKISSEKLKLLYKIMIETKNPAHINYYKSYKKIYRKVIKAAKKLNNEKIYNSSSSKSKAVWSIINSELGNKNNRSESIAEIKVDNEVIRNLVEIANQMNKHFTEIPNKLAKNFVDSEPVTTLTRNITHYPTIFIDPVTENEIFNIITDLKKSNSVGLDKISSNMLKSVVNHIVKPLTYLINRSLSEGIFPDILKVAKIIPLHKKGDKTSIDNYRPIALLSSISKILERVIFKRIVAFSLQHNILCDEQHGFRGGRSTTTAMLSFLNNLYDSLDKNNKCFGLFMDLSKAFDLVEHALLIEKLSNYGFRGKLSEWLVSYLSNRKQAVEINGVMSHTLDVTCGVPQGSVLGPLLFILFVNDLPSVANECNLIMFADDNSCLNYNKNVHDLTTDTQQKIESFVAKFNSDKLLINREKTVFIHFTPGFINYNESYLLSIKGKSLAQVNSTKFLGIHIDNSLNWQVHINVLCKKLSSVCFALYRLKPITNQSVLLSYYYAQFYSRLTYGIIFWGSSHYSERVFIFQKRALRNIVGVNRLTSCRNIFKQLQILPLACIYILEIVTYVKSNIHEFLRNSHNHTYDTRHQNNLIIPSHTLSLYERSPKYMGVKLYNKLPEHLRELNNVKHFRRKVRLYLLDHIFYNTSEYMECVF